MPTPEAITAAVTAAEFAHECSVGHIGFWEMLRDRCLKHAPLSEREGSMGPDESHRFERETMPWGQYKDLPIMDVPRWYLEKYCDDDPFKKRLRRYLRGNCPSN